MWEDNLRHLTSFIGLKGEPQGELDLPGGRCGARIRPCRWVETARAGEDQHRAGRRRAEGWMIQQVKKFRSELKRVVISDLEFPLKGDIDIEYGWSKQSVSSKVANRPCLRNTKDAGVKKQVRSSDFLSGFQNGCPRYGILAAGRDAVGWIVALSREQIGTRGSKQITWTANVDLGRGRDPGTKIDDASGPPASQHSQECTRKWRGRSPDGRQIIKKVCRDPMAYIEIGEAPIQGSEQAKLLGPSGEIQRRGIVHGFAVGVAGPK